MQRGLILATAYVYINKSLTKKFDKNDHPTYLATKCSGMKNCNLGLLQYADLVL